MTNRQKNELDLDSILVPAVADVTDVADSRTKLEVKTLESEERKARLAKLNQDLELRGQYSEKLYKLIMFWLIAIFLLLMIQGFAGVGGYFAISDKVLITIIGGTTINVLGLFAIVANYIFPKEASASRVVKKKKL